MRTAKSYIIKVVGRISNDGQQDFKNQSNLKYEKDAAAVRTALRIVCDVLRLLSRAVRTHAHRNAGGVCFGWAGNCSSFRGQR